jgi:hypothetical protein
MLTAVATIGTISQMRIRRWFGKAGVTWDGLLLVILLRVPFNRFAEVESRSASKRRQRAREETFET